MGELVDLTAYRQARGKEKPQVTWASIKEAAQDFLLTDWEKMARNNRLNEYFKRSLANQIDHGSKVNYMSDLNEIAALELNLELYPMIFFPGTLNGTQQQWVVQFKLDKETVCTPELASEAYARCFAILLFLKVKREAIVNGLLKNL
jgi:hypothetical protein